jgi:hypothetical protein
VLLPSAKGEGQEDDVLLRTGTFNFSNGTYTMLNRMLKAEVSDTRER